MGLLPVAPFVVSNACCIVCHPLAASELVVRRRHQAYPGYKKMDYSKIFEELKKASSFDLYRLKVAINQQLDDPARLSEIKRNLKPGQKICYFDETENRLIDAEVIEVMRTRLLVQNIDDQQRWKIPLYFVNLDMVNTDIAGPSQIGLDKSQVKVGDIVGFQDKQHNDVHGKIVLLNPKTATILTGENIKWRVSYKLLHLVLDIEQDSLVLIDV